MGRAAQLRNRYPRSRFRITDKLSSLTAPIIAIIGLLALAILF